MHVRPTRDRSFLFTFYSTHTRSVARTIVLGDPRTLHIVARGMQPLLTLGLSQNVVLHAFVDIALTTADVVRVADICKRTGLGTGTVDRTMRHFVLYFSLLFAPTGYSISGDRNGYRLNFPRVDAVDSPHIR